MWKGYERRGILAGRKTQSYPSIYCCCLGSLFFLITLSSCSYHTILKNEAHTLSSPPLSSSNTLSIHLPPLLTGEESLQAARLNKHARDDIGVHVGRRTPVLEVAALSRCTGKEGGRKGGLDADISRAKMRERSSHTHPIKKTKKSHTTRPTYLYSLFLSP